jgi:hypothetical protein
MSGCALFDRFDDKLQASSDHWHPQILEALAGMANITAGVADARQATADDTCLS